MWLKLYKEISIPFFALASLASIVSLILFFFAIPWAVIIALSVFCLTLIVFLICLIRVLNKFIEKENADNYKKKSSFMKFETSDGINSIFETYRHIQAKCTILYELEHSFKWTGSKMPDVTSNIQEVTHVIDNKTNTYDKAILKFKQPLLYNETAIVHFHAKCNDADGTAKPYLETRIDSQIDVIHYRIVLKHKTGKYSSNATLSRKKIASDMSADYETIKSINFDLSTKSYEHHLLSPEVGYYYKISWVK